MNTPEDQATPCSTCHKDYYQPVSIFNHTNHQAALEGNASCTECHTGEHTRRVTVDCGECHENMHNRSGGVLTNPAMASGYLDAMHNLCRDCHQREAVIRNKPQMAECITCHGSSLPIYQLGQAAAPTTR
jgi:hypothetical protein